MILIKNIEFIQTDRNIAEIISCISDAKPYESILFIDDKQIDIKYVHEIIRGRRFVRPTDNTDVYVGISKDASNILGLLYDSYEDYQKLYNKASDELRDIKNANIWKRFKYLIFGVK